MLKYRTLLEREEELVKLNAELDVETHGLLQQLDQAMKIKENRDLREETIMNGRLFEFTKMLPPSQNQIEQNLDHFMNTTKHRESDPVLVKPSSAPIMKKTKLEKIDKTQAVLPTANIGNGLTSPPKLTRHKSEVRIKEKLDGDIVPEIVKNTGQDGVLRFLKAKVQVLSDQMEAMHKEERDLVDKIKELQNERERVSEDRDKWIQQANVAKNMLEKHQQHASNVATLLQNAQAENVHLKKEVENLKKQIKSLTQSSGSNELRLNRCLEDVVRLRSSQQQMKQLEKDMKTAHKKNIDELTTAVRKVEKQKVELHHAFKKQQIVIDNLKKQRGLADAGRFLRSIEEDFMKFLDWNPNKS